MKALIVGGGIGGAAAALALQRQGVEATVLERAAEISEVGAGLWVTANGMAALRHLGCAPQVESRSGEMTVHVYRSIDDDRVLFQTRLGPDAARIFGAPSYQVHRADLLAALVDGLAPGTVRTGAQVADIRQEADGVTAVLDHGEEIRGDFLVGADGLRSTVRRFVAGGDEARFANLVAWRAVFPFERIAHLRLDPGEISTWAGPGRSVVAYPLRHGELYNFVGFVPISEVTRESWTRSADVADLRRSFAGVCAPLQTIIDSIDEAFVTGLYFRDPLERWHEGRAVLLGDAAHPALPTAGQGAAQALEDAVVLAARVTAHGPEDIESALVDYTIRRRGRTARVIALSRANAHMITLGDAELVRARDNRFRGMQDLDPLGQVPWNWLWSHDAAAAATRPFTEEPGPRPPGVDDGCVLSVEEQAAGWLGERAGRERHLLSVETPPPAVGLNLDGTHALEVASPTGTTSETVVLFLHGGGFVCGSARSSAASAARVAAALDASAVIVDYRLAPEHGYPAAADDAYRAYRALVRARPGARLVLCGVEAGAHLALGVAQAARHEGLASPGFLYLVSPWVDLQPTGQFDAHGLLRLDASGDNEARIVRAASYVQGTIAVDDPRVAPLKADLSGLPPMVIHAAAGESLRADAERLTTRAREQGVEVNLELFDDAPHDMHAFGDLTAARRALDRLREWGKEFARATKTGMR
ncbi:alpha/beta hydrolase fold domain-containing protein [Streptomyces sp. NPDC007162]|uniref:alpha/beta hydrolase fold domain-containing protein n=1 Tax=Streptomyces sp. NPDC007162 TaxID=3156917 RepID=UPI0033C9EFB4